ncbi:MAG: OadG family protein [Oscillospiraceae bacterium]|nr:OadG family protein [Oscillospiraceae bacterium]
MGLFSRKKKTEAVEVKEEVSAVSTSIPGEVIAAISAAVYCMFGEGARVMSVRRQQRTGRSAWSMAGLLENTRPF